MSKTINIDEIKEEVLAEVLEKGGPGSGRRGHKTPKNEYSEDLKDAIRNKDSKTIRELLSMKMPESLADKEHKKIMDYIKQKEKIMSGPNKQAKIPTRKIPFGKSNTGEGNISDIEEEILKEFMEKAKYIKRTGSPGNYKYEYAKTGSSSKRTPAEEGERAAREDNERARRKVQDETLRDIESGKEKRSGRELLDAMHAKKKEMQSKPKDEGNDKVTGVKTKKYSWGTFRRIESGINFSIPVHPEDWDVIKQGSGQFKDETGTSWKVEKDSAGTGVILSQIGGSSSVHLDESKMKKLEGNDMKKSDEENNMSDIEKEMEQMAEKMEKSSKTPIEELKETITQLGPEGLKKSLGQMSEEQKELLKSVLEDMAKAVSFDDEYAAPVRRQPIESTKLEEEVASDDEDEDLVKLEAAKHNHQGDVTPEGREGQVIKSEEVLKSMGDEDMMKMMSKMCQKGYGSDKMMKMCMAKGMDEAKAKKMIDQAMAEHKEKMHKSEENIEKVEKADSLEQTRKAQESDLGDGMQMKQPEEAQLSDTEKMTEGEPRAKKKKEKDLENDPEETADEVKCPEGKMKKSEELEKGGVDKYVKMIMSDKMQVQDVLKEAPDEMRDDILAKLREMKKMKKSYSWENPNALLKARTLGRNHHFNVNSYYDEAIKKTKEINEEDEIENDFYKGRGPDKKPRKKRGSGSGSIDPHHEKKKEMMASGIKASEKVLRQMGKDHPDYAMRKEKIKNMKARLKNSKEGDFKKSGNSYNLNDLIEKGGDRSWDQIQVENALNLYRMQSVQGNSKSFEENDLVEILGLDAEEAKKILG